MPPVQFVVPFVLPQTLRFVAPVAELPDVSLSVISQQPAEVLPEALRRRLVGHWQVRDALDPQQIADASRALAARHGAPVRLLGVLEQLQEPLGAVRDLLRIPGMGEGAARNFRDKAQMKTLLSGAGLPCARHALAESPEAARRFVAEAGFPVVVKPPAGAGAKATFRLEDAGQLAEALAMSPPGPGRPWMIEEFVRGDEHSFEVISIDGRPVWHSLTRYLPTPLEAVENPWIQWCVLLPREVDDPRFDDVRAAGFRALEVLGMGTGISHMEWFRRRDGSLALSEIAARPPGAQITTLIGWAHEFDFYRAWARLAVADEWQPRERRWAAGAAFLRGQGQGRVQAVRGLEQAQREVGDLVVESRLPTPGQPRSSSYEGEGYVVVRHRETAAVLHALHRIVSTVRVEVA